MPSYKQRYRRRNEVEITSLRYEPSKGIKELNEKPKQLTLSQLLWVCALCVLASALVFIDMVKGV